MPRRGHHAQRSVAIGQHPLAVGTRRHGGGGRGDRGEPGVRVGLAGGPPGGIEVAASQRVVGVAEPPRAVVRAHGARRRALVARDAGGVGERVVLAGCVRHARQERRRRGSAFPLEDAAHHEGDGQAGAGVAQHRQRVHAHADPGGVHPGQADHPRRRQDDARPGVAVDAQDRLRAVHELGQVHVLRQHRWVSVLRRRRHQAACVPRLRRRGEPPLLVHQVQRQDAVERDPGRLGDPAHLHQEAGRVPPDRVHEARCADELGHERRRWTVQPGGDVGVPALEQRPDRSSQRLAVGPATLARAAAAVDDRIGCHRHHTRYYRRPNASIRAGIAALR